jgi:hypothetical protein
VSLQDTEVFRQVIRKLVKREVERYSVHQGVVTATSLAASPPTCTVKILNSSNNAVCSILGSYAPHVGDTVQVQFLGKARLVLGSVPQTPAGISSGKTLLAQQVLAGTTASVTFSSIPQTFNHLRLVVIARSTQAAVNDNLIIRLNGDSGTNYCDQWSAVSNNVSSPSAAVSQSQAILGNIAAASVSSLEFTFQEVVIPGYTSTAFHKQVCTIFSGAVDQVAVANSLVMQVASRWLNTAAVNQIFLSPGNGSFPAGSAFYLYGEM